LTSHFTQDRSLRQEGFHPPRGAEAVSGIWRFSLYIIVKVSQNISNTNEIFTQYRELNMLGIEQCNLDWFWKLGKRYIYFVQAKVQWIKMLIWWRWWLKDFFQYSNAQISNFLMHTPLFFTGTWR
jgi:hypothetical protein